MGMPWNILILVPLNPRIIVEQPCWLNITIWSLQLLVTVYSPGMAPIYNRSNKILQEKNSLYLPWIIVMDHILLILECGTSVLPFTLKPMEFMYIHTTNLYLKQIIQKDSVLKMTQKQLDMTFL